jgi:hypothetical protein
MTIRLHRHIDVAISRRGRIRRRDFLKAVSLGAAGAGMRNWPDLMSVHADELRQRGMACILLWMQGGPSQFETWDPKPDHENGGETKAISTSVSGIQIAHGLPQVAKVMDDICLIRSMTSTEGSHPRGTYLMHTGYIPTASIKYPTLGSNVAHQLGDPKSDLPSFVQVGARFRGGSGAGYLGVDYDPFAVTSAGRPPDNSTLPTPEERFTRRLGLLDKLETEYSKSGGKQEVEDHRKLYEKTARMVKSPKMKAFDLSEESAAVRDAYGDSQFGSGCLLARRLVETGVTFVEVAAGNWDTHQDNFERTSQLCQQIDKPFAQLIRDLGERRLLEKTLIVWMGEFGRTPRINARAGRDHYPRAFSVALAGGRVKGGQVIGRTDASGANVDQRQVGVKDLFRTVFHGLGINPDHENMSSIGRPIKLVDEGEVIQEVFG